jgi:hypothetical protein
MATQLRILLADDQVPWPTEADNERTKAEIRREFAADKRKRKQRIDVEKAFADDHAWFNGLLAYLERTQGETVEPARTFKEAEHHLANPRDLGLDVAVVDLSWWGDYSLPQGAKERENRGLKLLEDGCKVPIICLSQEFRDNFELIRKVLERGALPVPKPLSRRSPKGLPLKLTKKERKLSYRTLYAAVQYLTRGRRRSKIEVFVSHAHEDGDLAQRLVRAINSGLRVPSDAIRCSSVPGYDFDPGTDVIKAMQDELIGASCVVGLLTPRSLKSQWCLFELGAAWGLARKTLFLSLGSKTLRDPPAGFQSIQASQLVEAEQLRRFLDELARITGWRKYKNRDAAEKALRELAKSASRSARAEPSRLDPSHRRI